MICKNLFLLCSVIGVWFPVVAQNDKIASLQLPAIFSDHLVFTDGSTKEVSANIQGSQVRLENPTGQKPKAVRYAWKNGSEASLFNSAGLPSSTFFIELK